MPRVFGLLSLMLAAVIVIAPAAAGDDIKKTKEIESIFSKLDANKDGKLSKDEFLKLADRFRDKDKARNELGQTFDKLDPNNKGLTRDQFRTFVETTAKKKEDEAKKKPEK